MAKDKKIDIKIPVDNLIQAPDMEVVTPERKPVIPEQFPQAPDMEVIHPERKVSIPTELAQAPDMETLIEASRPRISTEYPETRNIDLKNLFIPYDGEWMPDSDPIEIGPRNYKTLQNYRYGGEKIIHLESVKGYTKINTTNALPANYKTIRNGHQLRTPYTQKSYVLAHSAYASNAGRVYQNKAVVPAQGDFLGGATPTVLHEDAAVDLEGRFSDVPGGQVAYCNAKESCIWAGDEMPCAGFFTLFAPKIVGASDITFVDGGGSADTITDGGSEFVINGFEAGQIITVTGTTNNNTEFIIVSLVAGTITLATATVVAEANQSATIIADVKKYHTKTKDYTQAVNNEINSAAEAVTVDGDTVGNRWIVLTTRPAKGIKHYIRTANGTGSASTTCMVWAGDSFKLVTNASDGTDSSGSMKQTETYSFDSTAFVEATITGATIAFVDSGPDTITDSGNGFVTAGFLAGMRIEVTGSTSNDDIYTINTVAAGTLTLVSTDEVTAEGASATITITSIRIAKPLHFEGLYLYAYLFELSAGSADIYHVTVDAPFQKMIDIWDGVYRQPIQCQVGTGYQTAAGATAGSANLVASTGNGYTVKVPDADWPKIDIGAEIVANGVTQNVVAKYGPWATGSWLGMDANMRATWYNGGTGYTYTYANPEDAGSADYKDYTLEANEPSFADYPIGVVIDGLTGLDKIIIGFEERMSAIYFEMIADLVNTNSVKMLIAYWNGETYTNQEGTADSTYGLPGTEGVNKSCNRSGLVSWDPPDEEDEFRRTLFGVNGYFYRISFDGTLSGTKGGAAEVVIDTIKGIPAQLTVKPFKFSVPYKNRLMLCGYVDGKEGNRIDYSVTNAPDVHNGDESSMDGIQSLYVGGKEDLTCAIPIYNRFGSSIISALLLFKDSETYLLTGDGPDNYRIYTISRTIGCPAPLTLDAAEMGYTFAEEINRNSVAWMSFIGPMIFDGAAIVPITGVQTYFDPGKTARLQTDVIERARGWTDNTYKEYNLVIPSASGATNCNVWIVYDLVRKRWFEKEPGASEIPQAAWHVYDTDGIEYIYSGIDDGNVMRLENGATWADTSATAMSPVIETGDLFPSGDFWDITTIRRIKTVVKKISEASKNLAIAWSKDAETGTTSLTVHDLDAGDPVSKFTQNAPSGTPLRGWSHRLKFSLSAGFATETLFRPIGWGIQFFIEHDDIRDV